MTSAQPTLIAHTHANQRLFSDHYLDQILPELPEWKHGAGSDSEVRGKVRALYVGFTPSTNEAQTEQELIRPILSLLGHDFEVQPALKTPDGSKRPDYVLYHDAAGVAANKNVVLTDADLECGLAVADAKYWDRPLDQALQVGKDPFTNKNPGYQIAFYIQHTGLQWGILTNGRLWRLYHKDTAHKLDRYYEVDLPDLLNAEHPERFQYFLRFFERAAFGTGALSLERHLKASEDYARGVGESLRDQVYEALLHLGQGFLDFPRNGLQPEPATLKQIYDNSLILLYRLLFVLYAEARELLPVHESAPYRDDYSLLAIKDAVARKLKVGQHLLPSTCTVWPRLTALFEIINLGSPPLKVATFNGGLFDPERHPFLERHSVGDAHLQRAIDKLARVAGDWVDYRDLSERHLGTIYEGLLEFQLRPLDPSKAAPLTPKDGGAPFTVELVTDKGERKSSGSYYTPGFITRFMVEQAVGPVIDAALAKSAARGAEAQVQAVLNVNVLDCSMGSGHFLVEAVEYIARRLVEADVLPAGLLPPRSPSPTPSPRPLTPFDELAYWKRRVAQSCIYGVDLNPLAVDLAKLSLWLTTAAKDRPLSFLDHHLRPGNALVGARLDELNSTGTSAPKQSKAAANRLKKKEDAGQLTWASDSAFTQSMSRAVGNMWLIEESAATTVEEVKVQEKLYERLREDFTRKYSRLADLVTAVRFGMQVDPALWGPLTDYATGRTVARLPQLRKLLEDAESLTQAHRFFHWELEFPEVFFDRNGTSLGEAAGFDVVIGNPPYVRQERLAPLKPYFQSTYSSFHSVADLYLYFFEQALRMLQAGGRMAYISSGTFARSNFAAPFRQWFTAQAQIDVLVDFGENQPFPGAEMVRPTIAVLTKGANTRDFSTLFITDRVPDSLEAELTRSSIVCAPESLLQPEWVFQPATHSRLYEKLRSHARNLGSVADGKLYFGIKTGLTEAFIVDSTIREQLVGANPDTSDIIRPIVYGEDLRPWYQEDEGRYLILFPSGWSRKRFGQEVLESSAWAQLTDLFPTITEHLARFEASARKRTDQGEFWWEMRSCAYYDVFQRPKIFWPDISKLPRFSGSRGDLLCTNTAYVLDCSDAYMVGLLQSRASWFSISQICQPLRLRAGLWQYRLFTQFMARLPIPEMGDEDRKAVGSLAMHITELARARYSLHGKTRHQIQRDLGTPAKSLNQKLTAWWDLDFTTLRAEVQKVYKRDIPVKERSEWDEWLTDQRAEHRRLTDGIIALETELNDRVYRLFDLTPDEIRLIEETTKFQYGEV